MIRPADRNRENRVILHQRTVPESAAGPAQLMIVAACGAPVLGHSPGRAGPDPAGQARSGMSEIGAVSLRLALLLALAGFGAAVYAGRTRREDWTRVAERSVGVVFALVTAAIAALFVCFARHDYQLVYVAVALRAQHGAALPARRALGRPGRVAAAVALDAVRLLRGRGLVPPRARAPARCRGCAPCCSRTRSSSWCCWSRSATRSRSCRPGTSPPTARA